MNSHERRRRMRKMIRDAVQPIASALLLSGVTKIAIPRGSTLTFDLCRPDGTGNLRVMGHLVPPEFHVMWRDFPPSYSWERYRKIFDLSDYL